MQRRDRRVDAVRSRSSTWRARRSSSGPASAAEVVRRRVAQAVDAERSAGGAALRAALVVARGGVRVGGAGVERDELPAAELERHRLELERGEVDPQRVARPRRTATRAGRAGRSRRRPSRSRRASTASPARAGRAGSARRRRRAARGTARPPARPRSDRPEPCGDVALDRQPRTGAARARRRAARRPCRGRTRASPPPAAGRRARTRRSRRGRRRAPRRGRRRSGSAVTVTPRSIANGSASPPL